MTPFQGAGAGQAMEARLVLFFSQCAVVLNFQQDAQVLSTLLTHPRVTRNTVQQALRVYSEVRQPIAAAFQEASQAAGKLMTNSTMTVDELKVAFWQSGGSVWGRPKPEEDVQQAVELLEKTVTG